MPVLKPRVTVTPITRVELSEELLEQTAEERQVLVIYTLPINYYSIYVDPNTRLIDEATGAEARLVKAFNIAIYPEYTLVTPEMAEPRLVFEPLPRDCRSFILYEPNQPYMIPFRVRGIVRNELDVYGIQVGK